VNSKERERESQIELIKKIGHFGQHSLNMAVVPFVLLLFIALAIASSANAKVSDAAEADWLVQPPTQTAEVYYKTWKENVLSVCRSFSLTLFLSPCSHVLSGAVGRMLGRRPLRH
jgi:hypothetical protein